MKRTIESLSPEAQRALGPAISSVIRGSKNRTLGEPPEDDKLMELSDNTRNKIIIVLGSTGLAATIGGLTLEYGLPEIPLGISRIITAGGIGLMAIAACVYTFDPTFDIGSEKEEEWGDEDIL